MKDFLLLALSVISFAFVSYGQGQTNAKCELEALAIDAALGNTEAQYNLAVEFHRGEKVEQDLSAAAKLWALAAKGGEISAYNNLGHLTYYGRGVKQNFAEGVRLWRYAASRGHAESQAHLAVAFSDGKYLPRNYVEAYAWAMTSRHSNGLETNDELKQGIGAISADVLLEVEPKLSTVQLAQGKRKAALYIKQYGAK